MAGGWLLPGVLGGGLLLLLVAVLARFVRSPARRQRLADWGLAAALLAIVLSFGPRWLSVSLPSADVPEPQPIATTPDPAPAPPPVLQAAPELPADDGGPFVFAPVPEAAPPVLAAPAAPVVEQPAPAVAAPAISEPAPAVVAQAEPSWLDRVPWLLGWLGAAHAAIACVLLGRWFLGHVGLWRLLRQGEPVPDAVAALCRSLCEGRPLPRLLQSSRLRVPLSCGLLRPTILLPAPLCSRPTGSSLRWVLAHELTHLERRDVWSCFLFGLGEVVFYLVPWFWWLRRQARLCREYVADAAAVQGSAAEDYAQFLLNLTAAPVAPAGALGVTGQTSDLFRRVAMLLGTSGAVEKRAPWLWSLGIGAGLLGLAALVAGVGLITDKARADEPDKKADVKKDEPKKEEPKKEEPKKEEPKKDAFDPFADIDKLLPNPPPGFDPDQYKLMREQMKRVMEQMRKQMPAGGQFPIGPLGPGAGFPIGPLGGAGGFAGGFGGANRAFNPFGQDTMDSRLGARIEKPTDALVDQLDLPKGQGVVIEQVTADSAAAKAGMKPNDILLELNGKAVSNDPAELAKALDAIKANTPVDAVVMRKGKKETIKGLSLPEAKAPQFPGNRFGPGGINLPGAGGIGGIGGAGGIGGLPGGPGIGGIGGAGGGIGGLPGFPGLPGGANGVMTTVFRSGDRFTARHQEGNLVINVTGTVSDGKATTKSINVQDGAVHEKYESVDKVPEQYRDKVKGLVEMGEKGAVKVEIK
jgi:beta-lactamase regulating signal transducer with metallopeptidase domain/membrane-associated protease RseP (regulator of RpoE activity)